MKDGQEYTRRQSIKRGALYIPLVYAAINCQQQAYGADIVAGNASQAAVQAAVNAGANGDRVLMPSSSATWTTGIATNKQVIIREVTA